jgi:hypothetical protein
MQKKYELNLPEYPGNNLSLESPAIRCLLLIDPSLSFAGSAQFVLLPNNSNSA